MDRIRNRIIFICTVAMSASLLFGGMKAYADSTAGTKSVPETGTVDIGLEPGSDAIAVLPGQTINCCPVIRNRGSSCYVRMSYEFSAYGEYISVSGMPGSWFYHEADGKWYSREPLPGGGEIRVFEKIIFDSALPEEAREKTIRLFLTAEAVAIRDLEEDPKTGLFPDTGQKPGDGQLPESGRFPESVSAGISSVRTGDDSSPGFFLILAGSASLTLSSGIYLTGRKRKVIK